LDLPPLEEGFDEKRFFGFDIKYLRKTMEENVLGFMRLNIVNPPAGTYWGRFNNRTISHKWVDELYDSFAKSIDYCLEANTMDVALDPKWITIGKEKMMARLGGLDIEDLPLIAFTWEGAEAIKNNNLWVLSGNHRCLAILKYVKHLNEELQHAKERMEEITGKKTEVELANMGENAKQQLTAVRKHVEMIEEKIEQSSYWTVKVYDRGALSYVLRRPAGRLA
jgi:hypothetical protein